MKPDGFKVLAHKDFNEAAIELARREFDDVEVDSLDTEERLIQKLKGKDVLLVRSKPQVTKKAIDSADSLKAICRPGVGLNNIDVEAAKAKGVKVINTPEATTISVAELTLCLAISMLRKVPAAHASVKAGKWERSRFEGNELHGKTFGIMGFGKIGKAVADRLKPFGLNLVVYDPFVEREVAEPFGVTKVDDLYDFLGQCDLLSIHIALTPQTRGILGAREFAAMKRGSYFLNLARGELVDTQALHEALSSGHLAGAGLDVFEKEPPVGNPILQLDNVVMTPHQGANTFEGQSRAMAEGIRKIKEALK